MESVQLQIHPCLLGVGYAAMQSIVQAIPNVVTLGKKYAVTVMSVGTRSVLGSQMQVGCVKQLVPVSLNT